VSGTAPAIGDYQQTFYAPLESSLPLGNGAEFRNRPGYHQRFFGFEVQAVKQMSNNWMARVAFSTNSHHEYFDDPSVAVQDPTPSVTWPNIDGGAYITPTFGSGKSDIYLILPSYQFTASGVFQLPWQINVGGNLAARQGYGVPYYATETSSDPSLSRKRVLLVDPEEERLPAVVALDARVEKTFRFSGRTLALDLDIFNLLNRSTVLGRNYDVNSAEGFNQPLEIMNPRLFRLGARFEF
jgi:hypothetical protein